MAVCASPEERAPKKKTNSLLYGPDIFVLQNRRLLLDSMVPLLMANGAHSIALFKMLWCAIATITGLWKRPKATHTLRFVLLS